MRTRLLAAVLAGSVALTACGSAEDTPLTDAQGQWVDAFCNGVLPGMEAGFELRKQDAANPAAVKAAYLRLVTANATAFGAAEKKLTELGTPEKDLQQVHERLLKFVQQSAKSYQDAQAPVEKLEPNAQFWDEAEKILAEKNQVSSPEDLRATFQDLQKRPKYADALNKSQPCAEIKSKGQGLVTG
ncbi:hypothetical protein UK23_12195 [Lentzea aerocolonigenes]|uniref:Lipoprotein n=1 Tax=Lentzea aerocolonigenes TaxID=68170 RepID=A0A0F0H546_LENAE|nr:hypothetical protein [Lentzea aerocolonigenes]KJK49976.1 hypothetical protein UK23_12195 [Lentzea aerocolonigenes]